MFRTIVLLALFVANWVMWFHGGIWYRQQECRDSFDSLQAFGVLADDRGVSRLRNWEYIEMLVCDGRNAGEVK